MIKNIVFDFGHVLVDYDFMAYLSTIIKDKNERLKFAEIFCSQEFCDRCDRGAEPLTEIFRQVCLEYPQWKSYLTEFVRRHPEAITNEIPGMRSLIERLRAAGYKLYGLTNWNQTIYTTIAQFEILRMLDGRVISSEEKLIKPEKAIYLRLCEKYSLCPEECLFTDDKQINVDGAIAAGMDAVLFRDAPSFIADLQSRGIL